MASTLMKTLPLVLSQNIFRKVIPSCSQAFNCISKLNLQTSFIGVSNFSTSQRHHDLMEFFDKKENWGESYVTVGRPWRKDELRLKSNTDLHKLWYVLLKERNMIMTTEAEYNRKLELFPNPERLEKVEESMENLLDVVRERDRAFNLLETGEDGEPGKRWAYNAIGMGYWKKCSEHFKPIYMNNKGRTFGGWLNRYRCLFREKRLKDRSRVKRRAMAKVQFIEKHIPHLAGTMEPDYSEVKQPLMSTAKGPGETI